MSRPTLGIIGGGQLGSLLSDAAKKIHVKTVILSDDINSPAKNFTDKFIYGSYGRGRLSPTHAFQACTLSHSDTSPK